MNEIQFKSSYRCWYIFKKIQIPWYTKKNDKNDPKFHVVPIPFPPWHLFFHPMAVMLVAYRHLQWMNLPRCWTMVLGNVVFLNAINSILMTIIIDAPPIFQNVSEHWAPVARHDGETSTRSKKRRNFFNFWLNHAHPYCWPSSLEYRLSPLPYPISLWSLKQWNNGSLYRMIVYLVEGKLKHNDG